MRFQELNNLIEDLKEECGDALINSAIISFVQGQSLVAYNFSDQSASLLAKYTTFLSDTISNSRIGGIGDFYEVSLANNIKIFTLVFGEYCWCSILNTDKMPMGMIINVLLPECIRKFKACL